MVPDRQPQREQSQVWVRYRVPFAPAYAPLASPIEVFGPPNDPHRAAVCATIVAYLWCLKPKGP